MEIVVFALVGIVAGLSAGLFGIGGGLITVPAMIFLLPYFHGVDTQLFHVAIATSLAAIIPTAIMSSYGHYKKRAIRWSIVIRLAPGLVVGALCGVFLALYTSQSILEVAFGVFLLLVAFNMLRRPVQEAADVFQTQSVNPFAGLAIGAVSSLMGVGGGTMTVPYLVWKGLNIHQAIACSAFLGLPIALAATAAFFLARFTEHELTGGYIYFPALIGISLAAIIVAPLGVKLAHNLPVKTLEKLFAILLIVVAIKIITG